MSNNLDREDNGKFKGKGLGTKKNVTKPIGAMFPPKIDAILRSLDNRSEFIREAVIEKLRREGYQIEPEETID